jgi:hypothetical protein
MGTNLKQKMGTVVEGGCGGGVAHLCYFCGSWENAVRQFDALFAVA